jgi:hypothetical protein
MQQQGIDPVALPEKRPTSGKTAKVITGCGGCGCLFGLVATLAGAFLLVWGLTDSKVDELVVPSAGILALAVIISFFGVALLIGGIIAGRKAKKAAQGGGGPDGSAGPPPPQQQMQPPQQYPPQQPSAPQYPPGQDPSKPGGQGPQGY